MLRNNFIAAQNAREPLEISQDATLESTLDPGAQGNAFAGNRANQDHEMYHAMHGAIMDGNAGGSSAIANAGMRVAAKLGSAATRSEKEAEKSRGMYMQVMMQQILADLNSQIADMTDQIDLLDNVLDDRNNALWFVDSQEDLNNKEQEILSIILEEEGISAEEYFAMSHDERRQIAQDAQDSIEDRKKDFVEKRDDLEIIASANVDSEILNEPLPVRNNVFLDEKYEKAALRIEQEHQIEFDRHNISADNMKLLYDTIGTMEQEALSKEQEVRASTDNNNDISMIKDMSLSLG